MSFTLLQENVIDAGLCSGCGKCAGACKHIDLVDYVPVLLDNCVGDVEGNSCGLCYTTCSQVIQKPYDEIKREPLEIISLRDARQSQPPTDNFSGAVSAINEILLERGLVDSMILVRDEDGNGIPEMVSNKEKVHDYSGSTFKRTGILNVLAKELKDKSARIGLVATPCEIRGVEEMERRMGVDVLKISLFCKSQKRSGKTGPKNNYCARCQDFPGFLADISAGESGSEPGFTTLVAWTERGKNILHDAIEHGNFKQGTVNKQDVEKDITRKAARKLHSYPDVLRERVKKHVIENGSVTISSLSSELGVGTKDVRYETLRLVQERVLSMKVDDESDEVEFGIYCDD
ncbi:MAG: Coenzyme F420 hydrogenase/dehydrogenase, beta subunit C-terminal domain [Promethearchaeota archaeon]